MSCFHPNLMSCFVDPETGSLRYLFEGPAKMTDPLKYGSVDDLTTKGRYQFTIPCGKCVGCRLDYSREWANRMIIELNDNEKAVFVTLTYNNANLPISEFGSPTLSVRDVQLFFKRLRKHFKGVRIRYYIAGEYGSKTFRPHYHAIIYGIGLDSFYDIRMFGYNELKDPYYTSQTLENIWSYGFVMLSGVTYKTCAYVARYVTKKQGFNDDFIVESGSLPSFNLSSRKPGIGMLHAEEMVISGNNMFSIDGRDGVKDVPLPKSFIRHTKNLGNYVDFCSEIQYSRTKDASERLKSNLLFSEKSFKDFLESKELTLMSKFKLLPERDFNEKAF